MRTAVAVASLIVLLGNTVLYSEPATAAEGDLWALDRENVNIRSGPSTNTDILMTVGPIDGIVEIASKGEWFFVEFPEQRVRGWVFGPLLVEHDASRAPSPTTATTAPAAEAPAAASVQATPAPAPAPVPTNDAGQQQAPATQTAAVSLDQEPAAVKTFRETVSELNDRAVSVAGINLFNDVRSTGGGGVQVLATDAWVSVPEAGQSSYMNALFDRWQSMANGLGPLSLQIVDPNGQVMMERTGS